MQVLFKANRNLILKSNSEPMHVRITDQGFWLLKHRELASAVIDAIHNSHTEFLNGEKISVETKDAKVEVRLASQLAGPDEDCKTKQD